MQKETFKESSHSRGPGKMVLTVNKRGTNEIQSLSNAGSLKLIEEKYNLEG